MPKKVEDPKERTRKWPRGKTLQNASGRDASPQEQQEDVKDEKIYHT